MSRILIVVAVALFVIAGLADLTSTPDWHPFALLVFGLAAWALASIAPSTLR